MGFAVDIVGGRSWSLSYNIHYLVFWLVHPILLELSIFGLEICNYLLQILVNLVLLLELLDLGSELLLKLVLEGIRSRSLDDAALRHVGNDLF